MAIPSNRKGAISLLAVIGIALAIALLPSATRTARAQADVFDLALVTSVVGGATTVEPNEDVNFEITVFNQGTVSVPRNTVSVVNYIPAGWVLTSPTTAGWTLNADGSATRLIRTTLSPGDSETVTIRLESPSGDGSHVNWAEISEDGALALGLVDIDSTPDTTNGTSTESPLDDVIDGSGGDEDDHDLAPIETLAHSDISVTKFVNGNNNATLATTEGIQFDSPFTYRIEARNLGPSAATNVQILDEFPPGVTVISSDDPTFDLTTGLWTIPALADGERRRLEISVEVTESDLFTYLDGFGWNVASLVGLDQIDDEPSNNVGLANGVYTPRDRADLEVRVTIDGNGDGTFADFEQITIDTPFTTRTIVTNHGPGLATAVGVDFQLAPGITGGDTPASTPYVRVGESVTFDQTHVVTAADQASFEQGPGLVWAQISAVGQTDPDSSPGTSVNDGIEDDEDSAAALLGTDALIDLELNQLVPAGGLYPEFAFEWTLELRNRGVVDANGVVVQNLLPTGVQLNAVELTAFDLNTGAETVLDSANFDVGSGLWSVGTVPVDTIVTAELTAILPFDNVPAFEAGDGVNAAQIVAASGFDIDSDPGTDTPDGIGPDKGIDGTVEDDETLHEFFLSESTDLAVDKVVDGNDDGIFTTTEFVYLDEPFIWRLAVSNESLLHEATGVVAHDLLPAGITLISADSPDFDITTGLWTIGTVPVGETVSVDVIAMVASADEQTFLDDGDRNWLQITALDQDDRDSEPGTDEPSGFGSSKGPDGAREDDEDSARVRLAPVDSIDLEVSATLDGNSDDDFNRNEDVDAETDFVWRLTVVNDGLADGTGIVLENLAPNGTTLVAASDPSFDLSTGIWSVGALASGDSATVDVTARVEAADQLDFLADGGRNWIQVIAADQDDVDSEPETRDPDGGEDDETSSTARLVPLGAVDLEVETTIDGNGDGNFASAEVIATNTPFVWRIQVTNTSSTLATGVELANELPAGVSLVSHDLADFDPASGVWNVGLVPSGETLTLNLVAEIIDADLPAFLAGSTLDWAQITTADQPDADSDPGTDPADGRGLDRGEDGRDEDDENAARAIYVDPSMADLSVTKTIDGNGDRDYSGSEEMTFDTPFTWRIAVTNDGPATATNVMVADYAPDGLMFIDADDPSFDTTAGTWAIPSIAPGESATVELTSIVTRANLSAFEDGNGTNWAEVTAADQLDPDSDPGTDTADGSQDDEDSATAILSLASTIDLSLDKVVDGNGDGTFAEVESVNVGIPFTWRISITNDGPETATGVVVEDYHPAGAIIIETDDPRFNPATNIWSIPSIGAGETQVVHLTAVVTEETFEQMNIDGGVNWAEVTDADQLDPDSLPARNTANGDEDDEDSATVVLNPFTPRVDLQLTKSIDGDGDGVFAATETVEIDQPFAWTITVANRSSITATGVVVEDLLPAGLTAITADSADFDVENGRWTVGSVPANSEVSLVISSTVTSATQDAFRSTNGENWAQITAADQEDPDSLPATGTPTGFGADRGEDGPIEDDEASARAVLSGATMADLEVRKLIDGDGDGAFANQELVTPGQTFTWQVSVSNRGEVDATNVEITDHPPLGLTMTSADTDDFDLTTGVWSVGTVPVGETVTLHIDSVVNAADVDTFVAGDGQNWAEVSASDQVDPDSEPGTNTADGDQDDEDDATAVVEGTPATTTTTTVPPTTAPPTTVPPGAAATTVPPTTVPPGTAATTVPDGAAGAATGVDLSVTKSRLDPVVPGTEVRWSLIATNNGSEDDPGPVTLIDQLPPSLTGVSGTGAGFSCSASSATSSITCVRPDGLAAGESATVIVTTRVDPQLPVGSQITNQAIVGSATAEQSAANNTAASSADVEAGGTASGRLPFTGRGLTSVTIGALILISYGLNLRLGSRRPTTREQ